MPQYPTHPWPLLLSQHSACAERRTHDALLLPPPLFFAIHSLYQNAYFVTIGKSISHSLGYAMLAAAVVAQFSSFNARIAATARVVQACSRLRMLPSLLSWNVRPWGTPVPAVLLQGGLTMAMVELSFGELVILGASLVRGLPGVVLLLWWWWRW